MPLGSQPKDTHALNICIGNEFESYRTKGIFGIEVL